MRPRGLAVRLTGLVALLGGAAACGPPRGAGLLTDDGSAAPICPRDAERSPSGRCACTPGHLVVLGACLPPPIGDRYCGPAATMLPAAGAPETSNGELAAGGCAFRPCDGTSWQTRDVVTGACVSTRGTGGGDPLTCRAGAAAIVEDGRPECVAPADTCPRGTSRGEGAAAKVCGTGPICPPGSLPAGAMCRPIVVFGARGSPRVDLGVWAALVLGADEGAGSANLCRPIALRPGAFNVQRGSAMDLRLHISLVVPDQDVTRVHAEFRLGDDASTAASGSSRSAKSARSTEEDVLASALAPLIEALRGLGGEASAAAVDLTVHCAIASL